MTEKTVKCDRCGKVISGEPFYLSFFKPMRFIIKFSERPEFSTTCHDLCYDCWEELRDWFFCDKESGKIRSMLRSKLNE